MGQLYGAGGVDYKKKEGKEREKGERREEREKGEREERKGENKLSVACIQRFNVFSHEIC
jgi:hypothetical protein